jgi:predicted permease
MARDLLITLRIARRHPGATATIVLTLALGLGAATAIFSVAYAIWLKPSPFANVSRLVSLREVQERSGLGAGASLATIRTIRERGTSFAGVAAYVYGASFVVRDGERRKIITYSVSPPLFELLGARPSMGRGFVPADARDGGRTVAILSDHFWRTFFNADPAIVGRQVSFEQWTFTVIGVMPRDFHFPESQESDLWLPMNEETAVVDRAYRYFRSVGLLKPGVAAESVASELEAIADGQAAAFPATNAGWTIVARRMQSVSPGVRKAFGVLLAAVSLLLAIACANIASVLLARYAARGRELATRAALGATRWQLLRLVLVESTVWSVAGGGLGVLAAAYLVPSLVALMPRVSARTGDARIDGPVLCFGLAATIAASALCGIVPALRASRQNARGLGDRGTVAHGSRANAAIVAIEVALSLVLLVGGGLMMRSFSAILARDRGFDTDRLLSAHLVLPFDRFQSPDARRAIVNEMATRLRAIEGITSVGAVTGYPGSAMGYLGAGPVVAADAPDRPNVFAAVRSATGSYFPAMRARLIEGRVFDDTDERAAEPRLVISRTLASRLWPGERAVGRRVRAAQTLSSALPAGHDYEVIGVVGDMSDDGTGSVDLFMPFGLSNAFWFDLMVRTDRDAAPLAAPVRAAIKSIANDFSIDGLATMETVLTEASALEHAQSILVMTFAGISAALTAIGLFGLLSYTVSLRAGEIGVRMALGATPGDVFTAVLRQGVGLVLVGIAIGGALIAAALPWLRSQVFGLERLDPWTIAAAPVLLILTALAAAYIPARRALRVDPLTSLRG